MYLKQILVIQTIAVSYTHLEIMGEEKARPSIMDEQKAEVTEQTSPAEVSQEAAPVEVQQ